jgi:hypothetical protein
MASTKIIIIGNSGSGKTEFIRTLTRKNSNNDLPVTAESQRKETAAKSQKKVSESLDFDRLVIHEDLVLNLYGVPGERNLSFMWQALAKDALGYILLVDSTRPEALLDTREILRLIQSFKKKHYLIAVNKMELPGAMSIEKIRKLLELGSEVTLCPCDARVKGSVKEIVISLLEKAKG